MLYKNIGVSLNDPRILPVFLTFFELKIPTEIGK